MPGSGGLMPRRSAQSRTVLVAVPLAFLRGLLLDR